MKITVYFVGEKKSDTEFECKEILAKVFFVAWFHRFFLDLRGVEEIPRELIERGTIDFLRNLLGSKEWEPSIFSHPTRVESSLKDKIEKEVLPKLELEKGEKGERSVNVYLRDPKLKIVDERGWLGRLIPRGTLIEFSIPLEISIRREFIQGMKPKNSPRPYVEKILDELLSIVEDEIDDLAAEVLKGAYFRVKDDITSVDRETLSESFFLLSLSLRGMQLKSSELREALIGVEKYPTLLYLTVTFPNPLTIRLKEEWGEREISDFIISLSSFFVGSGISEKDFSMLVQILDLVKEGELGLDVKFVEKLPVFP